MNLFTDSFATPFGTFSVAVDDAGRLVATAFGDLSALRRRLAACGLNADTSRPCEVREQVLAYARGELRDFTLPLAPLGTVFQHQVWSALARIPFGETRTYRQLAVAIGRPHAARAVGRANATNPLCLIVPCHRVIGSDGSLTGFAFGEDLKRRLLEHERAFTARAHAA